LFDQLQANIAACKGKNTMRRIALVAALMGLGLCLTGCAVAEVGGAVVGAGVSAASTAVSVTGDVVSAPFGGDDDKSK
jgi:hypothetical protein